MKSFLPELPFHILVPTKSKAEVDNFQVIRVFVKKDDVFQFKVTMTNMLSMKIWDSFNKL